MKCPGNKMKIQVGDQLCGGIVVRICYYPYWHPYMIRGYVISKENMEQFIRNIDIREGDWRKR